MKRVALLRHAAAELAAHQSPTDAFSMADTRLSPIGVRQAEAARDALRKAPVDAVFASPAARALHTAEIVAGPHGLDVAADEDLLEVPFGPYGSDYAEILAAIRAFPARFHDEADPVFPNGERVSEALARVQRGIARATAAASFPVVVSHGIANRLVLGHVLGIPPRRLLELDQDHACLNLLEWRRGRVVARLINAPPGTAPPLPEDRFS